MPGEMLHVQSLSIDHLQTASADLPDSDRPIPAARQYPGLASVENSVVDAVGVTSEFLEQVSSRKLPEADNSVAGTGKYFVLGRAELHRPDVPAMTRQNAKALA
jgi:hypothetical protein